MKCAWCGADIGGSWKFCPGCGKAVPNISMISDANAKVEGKKPNRLTSRVLFAIVGVLVCLWAIGSVTSTSGSGSGGQPKKSDAEILAEYQTALSEISDSGVSKEPARLLALVRQLKSPPNDELRSAYEKVLPDAALAYANAEVGRLASPDLPLAEQFKGFATLAADLKRDFRADPAALEAAETAASGIVKGIPGANLEGNRDGYKLLREINPGNTEYADKVKLYDDKIVQRQEAEKAAAQREKDALVRKILSAYSVSTDKFNDTKFYKHKNSPAYTSSRSTVYLYMGVSGTHAWLRMQTQYASKSWLFVDRVEAYADGATFTLTTGKFERDNNSTIWEWCDESPSASQIATLEKLANAKDATLRFIGHQYRDDKTLSAGDKAALRAVLADYEKLKQALEK